MMMVSTTITLALAMNLQAFSAWSQGATRASGKTAQWRVSADGSYGISNLGKVSDGRFNLAWDGKSRAKDVTIEVLFRAVSGKVDQGGGVVWRMLDEDNYYISRYNPLEGNLRVYYVRNGKRKTLGSTRLALPRAAWHKLKVVHSGNHIECFLNGKKLLDAIDATLSKPGMIGLWTKADSITQFKDLKVGSP